MRTLKVALLGCGTVGSEVFRLLGQQADDLAARIGARVEVAGVAVRRPGRSRAVPIEPGLLTADSMSLVTRTRMLGRRSGGVVVVTPGLVTTGSVR